MCLCVCGGTTIARHLPQSALSAGARALNENMASCDVSDANENDCPRSHGEAVAFFLSRSQNNSTAELRQPTHNAVRPAVLRNSGNRESRISQHIQLFEGASSAGFARPRHPPAAAADSSGMSVSLMATSSDPLPEVLREPVYMNVGECARSRKSVLAVAKKKPVPNPRRSLFLPIAEGTVVLDCTQDLLRSSPRRRPPASPVPEQSVPSVQVWTLLRLFCPATFRSSRLSVCSSVCRST